MLLFPFIILTGEPASVSGLLVNGVHGGEEWKWGVFIVGSGVTGVCGFMLCVAGLLSIKVTSPVTHMFSSVSSDTIGVNLLLTLVLILKYLLMQAARGVLQTLLGVWIFKDILTVCVPLSFAIL